MDALISAKRLTHYLIMVLTLAIVSACSNQLKPKEYPPALFSELNNSSAFFLEKADQVSEEISLPWQLVALQALILEKKPLMANSLVEYFKSVPLNAQQQSALTVLMAENLSLQNKDDDALAMLKSVDSKPLSEIGRVYFLKLQLRLQLDKKDHQGATDTLLILSQLVSSNDQKQYYHDLLFSQLILLPTDLLNSLPVNAQPIDTQPVASQSITSVNPIQQGWYELASLYQQYQLRPNQLTRSIDSWKKRNPTHPALTAMPALLDELPELSPFQPENIAVLIPLSGRFQQQGVAIQYGLLDAYYGQQSQKDNDSTTVKLHFFDTQKESIENIISQFGAKNIDFVIGPLLKRNVNAFLPLVKNMPVLALNSFAKQTQQTQETTEIEEENSPETMETASAIENQQVVVAENKQIPWHYAFPLSPEDEAKQAARFILAQGHKRPMLIAPDSPYGLRITQAFSQEWQRLSLDHLSAPESYFFNKQVQLAPFIENALQIDKSKQRIAQMKMITQLPLETERRSRRDIDAIYIISKREELLMLKAFVDVSISPFAPTIPLYASSRSHLNDQNNKELSMLTFSDIALLLEKDNVSLKKIQQTWQKQSFSTLRLFALGFDSYQLIGQLVQLQNNENYHYKGLIGQLSLGSDNTVQATLNWAKYQQGKLIEITSLTATE